MDAYEPTVVQITNRDSLDFALYNPPKAAVFTQLTIEKKYFHCRRAAIEAQRISDCWILNLLGDNK